MATETETIQPIISTIDPRKLIEHPTNSKIYGVESLDLGLVASIRDQGILEPVLLTETTHGGKTGLYILSGHRRVKAAIEVGIEVPCRLETDLGEEWQRGVLLEANRQRVKTIEQSAREYIELKRLEKLNPTGKGTASIRASQQVGLREDRARRLEVIIAAADDGNVTAIEGLKKINTHERSVVSVFRAVSSGEEETAGGEVHYEEVAQAFAESTNDFFQVVPSPKGKHGHGYIFRTRFADRMVAEAFIEMLKRIPREAQETFDAVLAKSE